MTTVDTRPPIDAAPTTDHGLFVRAARWWLDEHGTFREVPFEWDWGMNPKIAWRLHIRHRQPDAYSDPRSEVYVTSVREALAVLVALGMLPAHLTHTDSTRLLIAQTVAAHVDMMARNPDGTLLQDRPEGALMACSCGRWSQRVTAEPLAEAWDEFRLHRADAILTALDGAQ